MLGVLDSEAFPVCGASLKFRFGMWAGHWGSLHFVGPDIRVNFIRQKP